MSLGRTAFRHTVHFGHPAEALPSRTPYSNRCALADRLHLSRIADEVGAQRGVEIRRERHVGVGVDNQHYARFLGLVLDPMLTRVVEHQRYALLPMEMMATDLDPAFLRLFGHDQRIVKADDAGRCASVQHDLGAAALLSPGTTASAAPLDGFGAPLAEIHVPAGVLTLEQKSAMIKGVSEVLIKAIKLPPDRFRYLWVQVIETAAGG
jgi:hypothetical protein